MDVLHAVDDDLAHLLEALVPAHGRDRVALDEDVALREELDGLRVCEEEDQLVSESSGGRARGTHLEGGPARAEDALPPLDKALVVADDVADLDNVAVHAVLEDADRLQDEGRERVLRGKGRERERGRTCGKGTLRARSLMRSRALRMMYGSKVLRVVLTVIEPSTRSRMASMPCVHRAARQLDPVGAQEGRGTGRTCFLSAVSTWPQISRRYVSRYLAKSCGWEGRGVSARSCRPPPGLEDGERCAHRGKAALLEEDALHVALLERLDGPVVRPLDVPPAGAHEWVSPAR